MGMPSPFLGAAASPVRARSKQSTPEIPLLKTVDEFNGLEVLELCPDTFDPWTQISQATGDDASPALDIPEGVQVFSMSDTESDRCSEDRPVQGDCRHHQPIPEWPSHLPDYSKEFTELNTFLELPASLRQTRVESRPRAGSDWTGVRALEEGGVSVCLEDLRRPLPPPVQRCEEQSLQQEQAYASCTPQWCWWVQDEVTGAWVMMNDPTAQDATQMWPEEQDCYQMWPGEQAWPAPPEGATCLPPLQADGQAYRPKWVYGSSWPFNTAPTSLILDNLPRDLTHAELLAVLDASGFRGLYDFAFLPASLRTGRNQGSAIVNLTRHSYGLALAARAQGFSDWGESADGRCCEVKWSLPLQGIAEHIENYRNHPAMHESVPEAFRPGVFVNGWQVPFPRPTKKIRAPRLGQW